MGRIPDDKFRIFISHKSSDTSIAIDVKNAIESLSPKNFECWVDAQDIAAGSDWSRSILKALGNSHLLLLLFTVPERKWDWCLYEAGLFIQFSNAEDEDVRSVVSIFDPKSGPPRPLSGVQGAPAEPKALEKFLERLCKEPWEISDDWRKGAIAPKVKQETISAAAQEIATSFRTHLSRAVEPLADPSMIQRQPQCRFPRQIQPAAPLRFPVRHLIEKLRQQQRCHHRRRMRRPAPPRPIQPIEVGVAERRAPGPTQRGQEPFIVQQVGAQHAAISQQALRLSRAPHPTSQNHTPVIPIPTKAAREHPTAD